MFPAVCGYLHDLLMGGEVDCRLSRNLVPALSGISVFPGSVHLEEGAGGEPEQANDGWGKENL